MASYPPQNLIPPGGQNALRFDDSANPILYLGEAAPGTTDSQALWRIQRITTGAGVTIEWADGNDYFDNVWDDRAALSYA